MKAKQITLEFLIACLVLLFIYTATAKLIKFEDFKLAMGAQPIIPGLKTLLVYTLPPVEILVVVLMATNKFRKIGLWASLGLLLVFTGYIILIKLNYYGRIPCSCGGVIKSLDWTEHLFFNLFFTTVNIGAILLHRNITKQGLNNGPMKYTVG